MRFQISTMSFEINDRGIHAMGCVGDVRLEVAFRPASSANPSHFLSAKIGDALFNIEFDIPDKKPNLVYSRYNEDKGINEHYNQSTKEWEPEEVG